MEIPVDPVLMRGISLLLSKNPESSRQLIDLMTEHNGMTATMVDVWLGSGPPKTVGLSTPGQSVDDGRSPLPTSSGSAQLQAARAKKPDGRPKPKPGVLFSPDNVPARQEAVLKTTAAGELPKINIAAADVHQDSATKTDSTGPAALFSVPDNVKRKATPSSSSESVDDRRSPGHIRMPRKPISRPTLAASDPVKSAASRSSPHPSVKGSKEAKKHLAPAVVDLSSSEDVAESVSSRGSVEVLSPLSKSRSSTGLNDEDSSESDDMLKSSHDTRKRSHADLESSGSESDIGSGIARRPAQPPRKCKPTAGNLLDGLEISSTSDEEDGGNGSENSTNDGDSNERIDPTSPTNGLSSSASAGKMNIPGGRSSASHLKLPLKPLGHSGRSVPSAAQSPDTLVRTAPTTPTGGARPILVSQQSRPSSSGQGPSRHPSISGSSRKFEAMKKQAKKISQGRSSARK